MSESPVTSLAAPAKPKRHRRTKAEMEAARAVGAEPPKRDLSPEQEAAPAPAPEPASTKHRTAKAAPKMEEPPAPPAPPAPKARVAKGRGAAKEEPVAAVAPAAPAASAAPPTPLSPVAVAEPAVPAKAGRPRGRRPAGVPAPEAAAPPSAPPAPAALPVSVAPPPVAVAPPAPAPSAPAPAAPPTPTTAMPPAAAEAPQRVRRFSRPAVRTNTQPPPPPPPRPKPPVADGESALGGGFKRRFGRFRDKFREPRAAAAPSAMAKDPQQPRFRRSDEDLEAEAYMGPSDIPFDNSPPVISEGLVELTEKGFGFLREAKRLFVGHADDTFIQPDVCKKHNLRDGTMVKGECRRGPRGLQMYKILAINGGDPDKQREVPVFEELTVVNPNKRIKLETSPDRYTTRVIDMMSPIGKGQRGLIVAPPRTGKTTLLLHIAEAVVKNHPDIHLIILLVDERPEEVTEMRRVLPTAEIMASSNDLDVKSHVKIAMLAMERAKRLVELGRDVFILLDSITRVGRAFNNYGSAPGMGGGFTGSGGLGTSAMVIPRKIFAAARNTEEAGTLTILGTVLVETNSRMDDIIFQEFKGTGNMELVLDRKVSDQRVYPAIDIFQSGTRREELLLADWELDKISVLRRGLGGHRPIEAIERLISFLRRYPTNAQMLMSIPG